MNRSKASLQLFKTFTERLPEMQYFLSPPKNAAVYTFQGYGCGCEPFWPCMSLYVKTLDIAGIGHVLFIL